VLLRYFEGVVIFSRGFSRGRGVSRGTVLLENKLICQENRPPVKPPESSENI